MSLFSRRQIRLRPRHAVIGLAAGVQLALVALLVIAPLILAHEALGETKTSPEAQAQAMKDKALLASRCFQLAECSQDMLKQALCTTSGNCCLNDRCFEQHQNECQGATTGQDIAGFCFAKSPPFQLAVSIGGSSTVVELGDYIIKVYKFAVGIAAILAAVMMMVGGFMYLTAADSGRVSRGKEYIVDSLTGLAVVFGAFLLLNTVNPDTVSLTLPKIPVVKKQQFVGCSMTEYCAGCSIEYGVTKAFLDDLRSHKTGQGAFTGTGTSKEYCVEKYIVKDVSKGGYAVKCTGKVCTKTMYKMGSAEDAACNMNQFSCQKRKKPTDTPACGGNVAVEITKKSLPEGATLPTDNTKYPDWICRNCKGFGESCSPTGPNPNCCGGFCGKDKCTTGQPGDACNDDKDCASNICQTNWGNSCSDGLTGSPCADNKECSPGYKCSGSSLGGAKNFCTPGARFNRCVSGSECNSDVCVSGSRWWTSDDLWMCLDSPSYQIYGPCESNADCQNMTGGTANYCRKNQGQFICTEGSPGSWCDSNEECADKCDTDLHICTDGQPGSHCSSPANCVSGHCVKDGDFPVCTTGGPGSRCGTAEDCDKYFGQAMTCPNKRCVPT